MNKINNVVASIPGENDTSTNFTDVFITPRTLRHLYNIPSNETCSQTSNVQGFIVIFIL